ncbi:MAG: hypothetical protein ACI4PV_04745, partial [Butyricicoccus sp.]
MGYGLTGLEIPLFHRNPSRFKRAEKIPLTPQQPAGLFVFGTGQKDFQVIPYIQDRVVRITALNDGQWLKLHPACFPDLTGLTGKRPIKNRFSGQNRQQHLRSEAREIHIASGNLFPVGWPFGYGQIKIVH